LPIGPFLKMRFTVFALFAIVALVLAQVHKDIEPISFRVGLSKNVKVATLAHVDHAVLEAEDIAEKADLSNTLPLRIGKAVEVSYSLVNSGAFETLKDGSRVWRLEIVTPGAFHTNINFKKFALPHGATLHIVGKQSAQRYIGAFTSANNKEDGIFATGPLLGDSMIVEYYEPSDVVGLGELEIESIVHGYKNVFGEKNGRSGTCNNNVVCPLGDGWRDQIRAVTALMTASGQRFCTGSMMNNHNEDGRQLFLTAAHCGQAQTSWIALFNYQSVTCARGGQRFLNYTAAGMKPIARHAQSDFNLAEVIEPIDESYNVYLNGWSAIDQIVNWTMGIHHPAGDVKMISLSKVPTKQGQWSGGPPNTHWRVEPWFNGTTEPGSSGSPLYSPEKLVIGQLHGGSASCRNMAGFDVYGKISKSWDIGADRASRLKEHLDPANTGKRIQLGMNLNDAKRKSGKCPCVACKNSCQFLKLKTICMSTCDKVCSKCNGKCHH
jgi:hypothetical protein